MGGVSSASTKAAAQFHAYIILQRLISATMHRETNLKGSVIFYLEREVEVLKTVGSKIRIRVKLLRN